MKTNRVFLPLVVSGIIISVVSISLVAVGFNRLNKHAALKDTESKEHKQPTSLQGTATPTQGPALGIHTKESTNKLVVVTQNDDGSIVENDPSKYAMESYPNSVNVTFINGSRCTEIKYDGQSVWKHNATKHPNQYPTFVQLNMKYSTLLVNCQNKYRYVYEHRGNSWEPSDSGDMTTLPLS